MANYAYIDLESPTTLDVLESHVKKALKWFRGRLEVQRTTWDDEGPVLLVYIPKSETSDETEALRRGLAPGDPIGFPIALQGEGQRLAFRHGMNQFERWAQGVMEELLAEVYGAPIFFDATGQTVNPGARRYRVGRKHTFREYVTRSLGDEDSPYVQRAKSQTPEGFWE